jgi:phosphopantothenoylcysteine decarboxylase / phosphopantothenate---cysteine ligase
VTAGPTFEKIDAVRFIGNYSSGKMGFAIAEELAEQGAEVILVSGPVSVSTAKNGIHLIPAESAEEMYTACIENFPGCDGAVLSAAVADYTPAIPLEGKTKSGSDNLTLHLKPTKDIAASLGRIKKPNQILVGFALETSHEVENARAKLKKKNFDFIVLNSLNDEGAGFRVDTNKIAIISHDNKMLSFQLKSKREAAVDIVNEMMNLIK